MKIYRIAIDKNMIYSDDTGYIKGYQLSDGFWWITEFVINPKYRGMGLAKKLATHLPSKCKLQAYPMYNMKKVSISKEELISFYEGVGFKIVDKDKSIMVKE